MLYITTNGLSNSTDKLPPQEEVEICKQWINQFASKRKTINDSHGSYELKHKVEKWAEKYVCNGAFIQAAIDLDYDYKQIGNTPNAVFNMSFPRKGTEKYKLAFPER
ncbi:MAG: hypothetical protein OT477_14550 [Chloroflexi bacterium]|nr:hypothetical protein [Chloroflexota bacterium]